MLKDTSGFFLIDFLTMMDAYQKMIQLQSLPHSWHFELHTQSHVPDSTFKVGGGVIFL